MQVGFKGSGVFSVYIECLGSLVSGLFVCFGAWEI